MRIRYEVFWAEEFPTNDKTLGYIRSFDDKDKAIAYAREAANGWDSQRPRSVIVCQVRYEPIKEIIVARKVETTERDL